MLRNRKGFWTFPVSLLIVLTCFSACIPSCAAQEQEEIAYDDGVSDGWSAMGVGGQQAVRFSIPWGAAWLLTARCYISSDPASFKVHVYGSDGTTELTSSFEVTPTSTGWVDVDLGGLNIIVTEDFYISVEHEEQDNPKIGWDGTDPDGRSYYGTPGSWTLFGAAPPPPAGDLMIRAVVQRPTHGIRQEFVWDEDSGTFQTANIYTIGYLQDVIADMDQVLRSGPPLDGAALKTAPYTDTRAEVTVERYDLVYYHYANDSDLPYAYKPVVEITLANGWNVTVESGYVECGNVINITSPSGCSSIVYGDPHLLQAGGTQQQELAAVGHYVFDLGGYTLDLECVKMHAGFSIVTELSLTGPNGYRLLYGRNNDVRISGGTPAADVLLTAGRAAQPGTMEKQVKFTWDEGLLTNLTVVSEESLPAAGKPNLSFPYGFFSFNITGLEPGETVTVNLTLPYNIPSNSEYWKCHDGEWVDMTSQLGDNDGDNVLTLALTDGGLGDDDEEANGVIVDEGGPGWPFAIAVEPASGTVVQGGSTTATVTVTQGDGYSETVSLSASGQPADVYISFDPESGTPTFTSTMTINVGREAEPGIYTIIITGTGADEKIHTTTCELTVTAYPPVGGVVLPVNKLRLIAPWIGLFTLVGALFAAIAIKRREA